MCVRKIVSAAITIGIGYGVDSVTHSAIFVYIIYYMYYVCSERLEWIYECTAGAGRERKRADMGVVIHLWVKYFWAIFLSFSSPPSASTALQRSSCIVVWLIIIKYNPWFGIINIIYINCHFVSCLFSCAVLLWHNEHWRRTHSTSIMSHQCTNLRWHIAFGDGC